MSRIGKQPVKIPSGTQVIQNDRGAVTIKGPKGELSLTLHPRISIIINDQEILVKRKSEEKLDKSLHGLTRSLLNNMVVGVNTGYQKQLIIQGVGYKAQIQGKKITFNLGFSHPIELHIPAGLNVTQEQEKKHILTISGMDKQLVGEFSAKVRGLRKPEPYKGKGIHYSDEHIVRKAGKAAATKGAT